MTYMQQPVPLPAEDMLFAAAALGCRAPSIANSQPWRWRIRGDTLELRADRTRQLSVSDPDGQLMMVSCGAALHHASVALAVLGGEATLERTAEPADPDLIGRFRLVGRREVTAEDMRLHHALRTRHTDRRPFQGVGPLPDEVIVGLQKVAEPFGVSVYAFAPADVGFLALAARASAMIERRDAAYQEEMAAWTTQRDQSAGEGVPSTAAVPQVARAVPVRDYAPGGTPELRPGPGGDEFTAYLAFVTEQDSPQDWLRTGGAASAVLLEATAAGLASSVMSDVIEVPGARALLRSLIATGNPQLLVRVGDNAGAAPPTQLRGHRGGTDQLGLADD
jgi:nitroreductase